MSKIVVWNPNTAVYATSSSGTEKRSGGTVMFGGAITASDPITNAPTPDSIDGYGSAVSPTTSHPTRIQKALSAGTFAHVQTSTEFLVRGLQTKLAGQSTGGTILNMGSDFGRDSQHPSSGSRAYGVLSFTRNSGAHVTGVLAGSGMQFGADSESVPHITRAVPGALLISEDGKTSTVHHYSAKTS